MIGKMIKRTITMVLALLVLSLMVMPALDMMVGDSQSAAFAAEDYYKTWGNDVSEKDYQRMADKWPDYEPLRCNGWMTEVMKEVYDIPMSMGDWVIGTRTNFLNNSTVKPVKVISGSYAEIKETVDKVKPGDIVFFNSDKGGNGVWTHVGLIGKDHGLWHCTATSPGSKTGKYKTLTSWMKKYQNQGEYGAYAEVWRVLSSFKAASKVQVTKNNYPGKLRVAKYKKGIAVTVRQTLTYKADGPLVGKKINITATLNKNKVKQENGVLVYTKSKKITDGEKFGGSTNLKYTLKKSGKIKIYYRFIIDDNVKESTIMTVFTKIKYGSKVLKNFSDPSSLLRRIRFRTLETK
ncbi:MAG: hypothetical protein K5653_04750 [Clostridiales bacterium]|nr:hypothetical protein [Clostridiales bacterium]